MTLGDEKETPTESLSHSITVQLVEAVAIPSQKGCLVPVKPPTLCSTLVNMDCSSN